MGDKRKSNEADEPKATKKTNHVEASPQANRWSMLVEKVFAIKPIEHADAVVLAIGEIVKRTQTRSDCERLVEEVEKIDPDDTHRLLAVDEMIPISECDPSIVELVRGTISNEQTVHIVAYLLDQCDPALQKEVCDALAKLPAFNEATPCDAKRVASMVEKAAVYEQLRDELLDEYIDTGYLSLVVADASLAVGSKHVRKIKSLKVRARALLSPPPHTTCTCASRPLYTVYPFRVTQPP